MGEVYRATDVQLARDVAVKVLPEAFAGDAQRVERFRREAQILAALNHPNIATIHGLEVSDRALYLVMELVSGQTLAERLSSGPVAVKDALRIGSQLAEALNAAHQKGITHRDIKPGNIKVTPEGRVKILDFGLAKSAADRGHDALPDETPTLSALTTPGMLIGTPAYMSPEQMSGRAAGVPADIWAFGCVVYELLTGRRPFSTSSFAETIAAVLTSHPDWSRLPASTPKPIRDLLERCLVKEPSGRLQDIAQAHVTIDQVLHAYRAADESAVDFARSSGRIKSTRSLAVLPFVNAGGDPQMDYLGDGLTESLIFSLSRLPQLRVTAQSAVFRYKGTTDRARDIGRELGVEVVLTGRVQQRGESLRISAELVDVEQGWQLWGGQYRTSSNDIFQAEEEIAREISEGLRLKLSDEHAKMLSQRYTDNVEAYHLYLKGRFHWSKRTADGLARSLDYFRQAIECDPTYALAYAGLAEGYVPQGFYCHLPPTEAFPKARAAAERALEIDPDLSEARTVIGSVKATYEWDLAGAERELRAAIERSPHYPRAHQSLAECLTLQGRAEEAIAEMRFALNADPLSLYINAALVMTYYFAHRFDAAIAHGRTGLDLDPHFFPIRWYLGLAYQQTGQYAEAVAELEQARRLSDDSTLMVSSLGGALAAWGKVERARDILRDLHQTAERRYVSKVWVAAIHAALGEDDRALSSLERAREDRCAWLLRCLRLDPRFNSLRGHPRFQALLPAFART
jgi:serine/threonine-protein kinase